MNFRHRPTSATMGAPGPVMSVIRPRSFPRPSRPATAGFTLTEIIIACGVMALLLTALFTTYRSSTHSFQAGSWQLQSQKQAQIFLGRLRDLLEKASHAYSFSSALVPNIATLPIYIGTPFHNPPNEVAPTGTAGVMYFSVPTAFHAANPLLGALQRPGSWMGVSLHVIPGTHGRTLVLTQSGSDAQLNTPIPAPYGNALAGANFPPVPAARRIVTELDNVATLRIDTRTPGTISFAVTLRRTFSGRPVEVRENMRAKLLHADHQILNY
jgi:type II secretory pathway pseudopilin PulG